jgi:hypothetical protein
MPPAMWTSTRSFELYASPVAAAQLPSFQQAEGTGALGALEVEGARVALALAVAALSLCPPPQWQPETKRSASTERRMPLPNTCARFLLFAMTPSAGSVQFLAMLHT